MYRPNAATRWARIVVPVGIIALVGLRYAQSHGPDVASTATTEVTTTTTTNGVPSSVTNTVTVTTHSNSAEVTLTGTPAQERYFGALPKPPSGAKAWEKTQGDRGYLTPGAFVGAYYSADTQKDELAVAEQRGLDYAVRVNWHAGKDYVDAFIIHFATPAGASSFYLDRLQSDQNSFDRSGSVTVPGIADSRIFVKKALDSYGNAGTAGIALDGDSVIVDAMLTPAVPGADELSTMMINEYTALN